MVKHQSELQMYIDKVSVSDLQVVSSLIGSLDHLATFRMSEDILQVTVF